MGYSKVQARTVKQAVMAGDEQNTSVLDATNTTAVVAFTGPASKITMQSSGNLDYTYEVSANGQNFTSPVAATANTMTSYNTHNIAVLRLIRTAGSGRVSILAT